MNWVLFRNERAVRALLWSLPLTLVVSWLFTGWLFASKEPYSSPFERSHFATTLLTIELIAAYPILRWLPLSPRVREHELALPISLRELLLTRWLATCTALGLPILFSTSVLLVRSPPRQYGSILEAAAILLAPALLSATLFLLWRPTSPGLRRPELAAIGILSAIALAMPWFWRGPWVALLDSGCTGLLLCRDLPSAETLLEEGRSLPARPGNVGLAHAPRVGTLLTTVLLRGTVLRPAGLFALGYIVLLSFLVLRGSSGSLLLFVVLMLHHYLRIALSVLHGIGPLPVPRAHVLPLLVWPPLLALVFGKGLQREETTSSAYSSAIGSQVELDYDSARRLGTPAPFGPHLRIPPHLWELHHGPRAPVVTAPWGETFDPEPHPILWGISWIVYSPYDVGEASTPRFLAWQLERLTGAGWTEEALQARYSGWWGARTDRMESLADLSSNARRFLTALPPSSAPANAKPFELLLLQLLWLPVMAFALRRGTPPATRGEHGRRLFLRAAAIGVACAVAVSIFKLDLGDPAILPVLSSLVQRWIDARLHSSAVGWILLDAGVFVAGTWWLWRLLERMELPSRARFGWTRREVSAF